jgi:hypothetical protein
MICTYRLREHLGTHRVAAIMIRDIARMAAGVPVEAGPGSLETLGAEMR